MQPLYYVGAYVFSVFFIIWILIYGKGSREQREDVVTGALVWPLVIGVMLIASAVSLTIWVAGKPLNSFAAWCERRRLIKVENNELLRRIRKMEEKL